MRLHRLVGMLLIAGCPRTPSDGPPAAPPGSRDTAVLAAVFFHEIGVPPGTMPLCLRVRGAKGEIGDASDEVLAAVRSRYPEARKASECAGGGPDEAVRVRSSGESAGMLDIGPVEWDDADHARVKGGGLGRGKSSYVREVEYSLVRDGGGWRVASERVVVQT